MASNEYETITGVIPCFHDFRPGWDQINRIYDAALEVAGGERSTLLQEACPGR